MPPITSLDDLRSILLPVHTPGQAWDFGQLPQAVLGLERRDDLAVHTDLICMECVRQRASDPSSPAALAVAVREVLLELLTETNDANCQAIRVVAGLGPGLEQRGREDRLIEAGPLIMPGLRKETPDLDDVRKRMRNRSWPWLLDRLIELEEVSRRRRPQEGTRPTAGDSDTSDAAQRRRASLVDWISQSTGLGTSEISRQTEVLLRDAYPGGIEQIRETARRRALVPSRAVRATLEGFYGSFSGTGMTFYNRELQSSRVETSLLTRNGWTGSAEPYEGIGGRCRYRTDAAPVTPIAEAGLDAALLRLGEISLSGARVWDDPLYRLVEMDSVETARAPQFAVDRFAHYVFTMDLIANETLDAIARAAGNPQAVLDRQDEWLPLRSAYLPDTSSVVDFEGRLCCGGIAALVAYGEPDGSHTLLLQQRSQEILTFEGRRSVVPQGFHAPLWNSAREVDLGLTVLRELEEELFGRHEAMSPASLVSLPPYESSNRTPQMREMLLNPKAWQCDLTGIHVDLLTGNYNFSWLVRFSDLPTGAFAKNWEMLQPAAVSVDDANYSAAYNEALEGNWAEAGLFAFLEGLDHLQETTR